MTKVKRKPEWLKIQLSSGEKAAKVTSALRTNQLHTVCEEAHCPNIAECWRCGTATFMILGDICTRHCRFCAIATGNPQGMVDSDEPRNLANAINEMNLKYVVITQVTRDDLTDGGAEQFVKCIKEIRGGIKDREIKIELLISDLQGNKAALKSILDKKPIVLAHNIEVTRSVTNQVRSSKASYERSLEVLRTVKELSPGQLTKTSLMIGLGETEKDIIDTLKDLRSINVDMVTIGQYLQPSRKHLPVEKYYSPEKFEEYERIARKLGFKFVASGPLVRSSYRAAELFVTQHLNDRKQKML